jgi:hypothetical protein
MNTETEEDLTKVPVQIATCTKCNGTILVAVKESIDKATTREFARLMEVGCNVMMTNVLVARHNKWCLEPCEGMFNKRKKKNS